MFYKVINWLWYIFPLRINWAFFSIISFVRSLFDTIIGVSIKTLHYKNATVLKCYTTKTLLFKRKSLLKIIDKVLIIRCIKLMNEKYSNVIYFLKANHFYEPKLSTFLTSFCAGFSGNTNFSVKNKYTAIAYMETPPPFHQNNKLRLCLLSSFLR